MSWEDAHGETAKPGFTLYSVKHSVRSISDTLYERIRASSISGARVTRLPASPLREAMCQVVPKSDRQPKWEINCQPAIMRDMSDGTSTVVSRIINASCDAVYRAFLDQDALAIWLPPGSMRGVVHAFDGREGGAFSMSLVYPEGDRSAQGKTSDNTDTFRGRFEKLILNERIVWVVEFDSADPSFAGEMIVSTTLAPVGSGTKVTICCENIPRGIRPEDNEVGCRSTLEKLATFLDG